MRRRSTSAGPVRLQMSIGIHTGTFDFFLVGGHPPRARHRRRRRHRVRRDRGDRAGRGDRAQRRDRARSSTRSCSARAGTARCCSRAAPTCPRPCRRSSIPRASTSPTLLPAAYTRELRGEPSRPGAPARRDRVRRALRDGRAARASRARRRWPRRSRRASPRSRRACLRFDVTFAQTDMSKGAVKAILLAGAPRTAGGEEEELMLRATRAIIERPGPLPLRIGVNTGRVFAGIVGTLTRRTYTFYGDAINTAARIMARAGRRAAARPRGRARTLAHDLRRDADRAVQRQGQGRARARVGRRRGGRRARAGGDRPVRRARGRARRAARCARAARARGRARSRSSRARPASARRGCSASSARRPPVRARCACAARRWASTTRTRRPGRSCGARCSSSATPRRARSSDGSAPSCASARRALEPWLPLLGLVVGLSLPPTPETAALEERFVSERIAASVEALLEAIVSDAALIVVDDAHYMDEASAALLGHIASGHPRRGAGCSWSRTASTTRASAPPRISWPSGCRWRRSTSPRRACSSSS